MPVAYAYHLETYKYLHPVERQRDPLESELKGHDVWTVPGYATVVEPPVEKKGYDRVWNPDQEAWEYKEIEAQEPTKPKEPTELQKAKWNLWQAQDKLNNTDYINDKINDAVNTGNEELAAELRVKYADVFVQREQWREEVRHWEAEVARLQAEEPQE